MFLFSQPPPLRISLTSMSSCSHCSKWMTGVSSPRLSPLFFPVSESTEFGRSLPRRVASATAARIAFLHLDLIHAHRSVHDEGGHAGVLADGAFVLGGHVDIATDDVQRLRGLRARRFASGGRAHRRAHVGRQIGGGLGDQFEEAAGEEFHTSAPIPRPFAPARSACRDRNAQRRRSSWR